MGFNAFAGQKPAPRLKLPGVKLPNVQEKEVAAQCDRLAVDLGYTVERYEQRRASKICEGLPDRRYHKRIGGNGYRIWVELKAPGGKMTEDQCAWLEAENDAMGMATVIDDVATLARIFGLLRPPIGEAACRRECAQLIELCAKRGLRPKAKRGQRRA